MKMKNVLWATALTAITAGITYAVKQDKFKPAADKLKPALDKVMDIPVIAAAVDKVNELRQPANNDDPMADAQAGDGGSIGLAQAVANADDQAKAA